MLDNFSFPIIFLICVSMPVNSLADEFLEIILLSIKFY